MFVINLVRNLVASIRYRMMRAEIDAEIEEAVNARAAAEIERQQEEWAEERRRDYKLEFDQPGCDKYCGQLGCSDCGDEAADDLREQDLIFAQ